MVYIRQTSQTGQLPKQHSPMLNNKTGTRIKQRRNKGGRFRLVALCIAFVVFMLLISYIACIAYIFLGGGGKKVDNSNGQQQQQQPPPQQIRVPGGGNNNNNIHHHPEQRIVAYKDNKPKDKKKEDNNNNNKNNHKMEKAKVDNNGDPFSMDAAIAAAAADDNSNKPHNEPKVIRRNFKGKADGAGIKPQQILGLLSNDNNHADVADDSDTSPHPDPNHMLQAYIEPIDWVHWWNVQPLPVRNTTAEDLTTINYPKLRSCSKLPEQWPVDNYPDQDPFLPWIHDVFPTHDGKYIQFVAQNKRKCHTGTTEDEKKILAWTQPQAALFQHVPLQRIPQLLSNGTRSKSPRYRLSTHDDADHDGVATRFICKFRPSGDETLSQFNLDYDWAAYRKRLKFTFDQFNGGIKSIHTNQLLFKCPVPDHLVDIVKSGSSVKDDWATLFVDLIPVRTLPRYGNPTRFLQPYYKAEQLEITAENEHERFDPNEEWGSQHILPKIEHSGRWANIPICKPSLQTYPDHTNGDDDDTNKKEVVDEPEKKQHKLVACLWVSAGYATRGNRFAINDGQRRLLEWIHYNKLIGFDHFYVYDNSLANSAEDAVTLKPIVEALPANISYTYINWPSKVCNNRPNNVDSPGHRSSQYAAEASCRLRFGPHVDWIGQFDIDEYLIPMGDTSKQTTILPTLDKLDEQGYKIISFGSWRAWPRRDLIEEPVETNDEELCGQKKKSCFDLRVPMEHTILQTYNCDRQLPGQKTKQMPAEKQIYRPDYVLQHFIHYSTVTYLSSLNRDDWAKYAEAQPRSSNIFYIDDPNNSYRRIANPKYGFRKNVFPDPQSRFGDELEEGIMLHTKAVASQDTTDWLNACKTNYTGRWTCRIGVPYPQSVIDNSNDGAAIPEADEDGWVYNCYVNQKTENYFVPRLEQSMKDTLSSKQ